MRHGDWIQTYTGRQFWPLDPRPEDIDPLDIVVALSRQCRFSGHCREFYSVAQHSVLVSSKLPEGLQLWGLLHDASEAYLVDIPRPLKALPEFAAYREAEERIMACVCERFGLPTLMPAEVAAVDVRMLATEARDLMPNKPAAWNVLPEPYMSRVVPWHAKLAKDVFERDLRFLGIDVYSSMRKAT